MTNEEERDELMLDSMGPSSKGGFEIKTHAGGPQTAETLLFIADSMRTTLDEYDAPNYLEMEVKASDGKNYIMTLQRKGKITPHAARLAAESIVAKASSLIRDLTDRDECSFDHHGGCQAHGYLSLEPGELCPQQEAKDWAKQHEVQP